jgi:hypothetical protein
MNILLSCVPSGQNIGKKMPTLTTSPVGTKYIFKLIKKYLFAKNTFAVVSKIESRNLSFINLSS